MFPNTSCLGLRLFSLDRFPYCFQVVSSGDSRARDGDEKPQIHNEETKSDARLSIVTTHLTGLRGVAALIVYNWHMLLPFYPRLLQAYNNSDDSSVVQLPLIRFLFYGVNAVYFFSCLSGYVQSLKPLSTDANISYNQQCKQVARATAKRVALLLATTVPLTLISLIAIRMNLYRFADLGPDIPDFLRNMFPLRQSTLGAQLRDWLSFQSLIVTSVWDFKLVPPSHYGTHLWTVPLDIRASLLLMPFLCFGNRLSAGMKVLVPGLASVLLRIAYPDYGAGLVCVMTFLGACLAGVNNWSTSRLSNNLTKVLRTISGPLTWTSIYVASLPIVSKESVLGSNIHPWLYSISPTLSFIFGIPLLSSIMILSPPDCVWRFLNRKSIQEFGKTSFSFYLIHQIFVHLVGYPAVKYLRDCQGWPVVPSVAVSGLALFPVIAVAARTFDYYVTIPLRDFIKRTI